MYFGHKILVKHSRFIHIGSHMVVRQESDFQLMIQMVIESDVDLLCPLNVDRLVPTCRKIP